MLVRDPRSDADLLAATRDREAFAVFYRRHVRSVIVFCARRAATDEVGDLVSEVFATALVHRRRFDPARGTAAAWLAGIARHKVADAHRRGAVEARMYERIGGRSLALDSVELESALAGEDLLGGLSVEQRRAVSARVLDDRSYEQIASDENVSAQVVRQRVSRALRTLKARFGEVEQ